MTPLPTDPTRKSPSSPTKEASARPQLAVLPLEDRVVPAGQVVGTVFLDFNANGLLDSAGTLANNGNGSTSLPPDAGVGGVVVTAYDAANVAQGAATSTVSGAYTLTLLNTGPYRLEFTNVPANLFAGPHGSGATAVQSGTTVQFVPDGNTSANVINLSLVDPGRITPDNPNLLSNIYVVGENAGPAVVNFPYSSGTQNSDATLGNYALNTPTSVADNTVVGATWGLAFDNVTNRAYAAALTKRHTAFGIGGPGAIYTISPTGATAPTLFADLNALVGSTVAGTNFRGALGAGYDYTTDLAAFDRVGKSGLGGLAIDDTGTFMYTVGLADRKLYRIRIPANGAAPTAGDVTAFNIPLPVTVTGVGGANGANGDLRPFAVEYHNGIIYVGAVNSAETTGLAADLRAYVFAFNPASSGGPAFVNLAGAGTTTEAVFSQLLNYPRGFAHIGDTSPSVPGTQIEAEWNAWTATRLTLANTAAGERYAIYPQPELTGLAFDTNGNLTLGLRDRNGDQYGNFFTTDFAGTPAPGTKGISAGDTLRAAIVTPGNLSSGWTAENITAPPPANITGPTVGGQFFWQQDLPPNQQPTVNDHQALSVGGVLQLRGRDQVLVTGFDPIHLSGQYDLGGIRWFDTTGANAGGINKAYQTYLNSPTSFAKANGIGDLIAAAPLGREVGNRVWNDANGNGRQDPGEAGIQSVSVVLCQVVGGVSTPISTATTDASGNYYFSSYSGTSTANKRFGVSQLGGLIPAGTSYEVCIPVSDPALAGLQLSPFQAAAANALNNSDGVLSGSNFAIQNVATQRNGSAQHGNDIGFLVASASLSGFVYEDSNPSNTLNAGDAPLAGVTVVLTGTTGSGAITPLTTTTAADGSYSFTGLQAGTYTVTETQPAGYLNRGEQPGSTGGTAPQNGTVISAIPLAAGQASVSNNFGEVRPVQLSGNVYHDITNDGTFNAGDALIPNVTLTLTGTNDLGAAVSVQQVSGTGAYAFTALRPGTYSVSEAQPSGFANRTNNPGTVFTPGTGTAGTISGDVIQTVVLNSNANSPANNFGEILAATAQLSGFVYEDNDRSSSFNAGDTPIAGTTVVLTGTLSTGGAATPRTTTTAADGSYSFGSLQPGTYQVNETQPAGLLDFNDQIGSTGGTAGNDVLSVIPIDNAANNNSINNNFGEVRPVQLSGFVYHDINNDGTRNGGDLPLAGVTVVLTGTDDRGAAVTPQTTTTAADGSYSFTALRPGDYTVSETQPAGFTTRTNNPGTVFTPGTGTAGTVVGDAIQTIRLNSNANSPANNFGEVLPSNASLSGVVYEDNDRSSTFNAGDTPIGGATVVLTGTLSTGGAITPITTTTGGGGAYAFTGLQAGTYQVNETQPAGYLDFNDQIGSTGGTAGNDVLSAIPLAAGQNSVSNNFGEVRPVQLSGFVYEDVNNDGTRNGGDLPLAGVTVVLTGTTDLGAAIAPQTTTTAADGSYSFTALRPGTYSVTETQPANFTTRTNTPGTVFTPGTGTAGTVAGDVIQTVVLNSNANSPANNFGEIRTANAQLSGFVYEDNDRSSTRNAADAPITGVTVVLTGTPTAGGTITPRTTTTAADGSYAFTALIPGNYTVTETQPAGFLDFNDQIGSTGGTVANDVLSAIPIDNAGNANSVANNFGEVRPVQLSGFVYHDISNDGTFNAGDAPIGGVTVVLTGTTDLGAAITPQTTTTAADGSYSFTALRPGDYTVSETQPAGFTTRTNNPGTVFTPGTGTAGTVVGDAIQTIRLNSNANSPANNFGEILSANAQLSGFVYIDANNDGTFQGGETPIAGATVVLTGTLSTGGAATPRTTTTAADGSYAFTALLPGTYSVAETQPTTPANLLTGKNTAGTATTNGTNGTAGAVGDDNIRTVVLNSFGNSPANNFGEVVGAQLAGTVYEDVNNNGTFDSGTDAPLVAVTLVLTGTDDLGAVTRTSVTAADGSYSFAALRPGTYTVTETQPAGYLNRTNTAGATTNGTAGTVAGDVIQTVVLNSAGNSPGNNFGEVRPVQLSGFVYHDITNDGTFNAGDLPLAGVTVVLTGTTDLGAAVTPVTSTTAADGSYSFTALRPGTYSVTETQPANFTTRTNNPGTVFTPGTGTAGTVAGDVIQTVVLNSNANSPANNFGEVLTANAQLSGFVYEDLNDSNSLTPALDRPIAGVTVVLTGTLSTGGAAAPLTTTTAADGSYAFTALLPGTYTVTETQPAGFLNRGEQPGSTGGTAPQNGTVISAIPLVSLANSASNNFGEVRPVALAGNVYHDKNNNGVFDAGDALIPLTTLTLTGTTDLGTAVSLTQVTGGGAYAFTGLRPGTYSVAETQPAGFTTRTNNPGPAYNGTPGTVSGDNIQTVVLRSDGSSPDNNFGEIIPADAVLSGFVYRDPNLNGAREPGNGNEPGLAGVTVKLFREDGPGVLTQVGQAQTDANGFYSFAGLTPGLYRLVETQPVGFYSTKDAAGSTGGNAPGNNTITTVPLAASQNSANNNFGEVPRTNLFGYVWVDANRNGVFDPGEAPIPGAVVAIGGTAFTNTTISQPLTSGLAQGPLTAVTDANGRWDFLSLPPGTYNLTQTNTPAGLSDFRSQNASGQAVQSSTATTFGGVSAVDPAQGPLNFGKVSTSPPPVPQEASKQNFLGSSVLTSSSAPSNPLVGPSTGAVNTTPPFGIGTGNPAVPALVAVGAGAGFTPVIRVFDYGSRTEKFRIQAFEDGMTAGVRVTTGDINGDGVPDIIATAGPGAGPRVRVFDGTTGTAIRDFYAYPPQFRGGLYVAAADFNGDGRMDIVTGAGEGGGPNVRVFDGATGTLITSFFAFDGNQTGGARIAVGDFNGDGVPDIAASNGPGNTSLVRVFSGKGFGQIAQYTPYSATYTGGVFLAAGDLDGDGKAELVTGADQGGGPNVRTFDALTGQLRNSFFAYESSFTGGVRVTVRDITGDGRADIITGAGIGGASRLRVFSGATLLPVEEFYAFDSGVRTGVYLG